MKKIDKNDYSEAKYGRNALLAFSGIIFLLGLAAFAGGIVLLVFGCISNVTSEIAWKVSVGVILILIGLSGMGIGGYMFLVGLGMLKNKFGNVKDGNRAIGTVNVLKCDKCGRALDENSTFCSYCGREVEGVVKCECAAVNSIDAEFCKNCGKKLK